MTNAKSFANLPRHQRTAHHLIDAAARTWSTAPALDQPLPKGGYRTYSWIEYRQVAEEIAAALLAKGIRKGDIVGLASETRAEFYLADLGVMIAGGVSAAVYTSLSPADQVRTLRNCDPKLIFVENAKAMNVLLSAGARDLPVTWVVLSGEAENASTFAELLELGENAMVEDPGLMGRLKQEVKPDDYAILYLTSGATGEPKMGLVDHHSLIANCDLGPLVVPLGPEDCTLAFLPSAHITQRLVMQLLAIRMGVRVFFSEGLAKMPAEFKRIRPTFFVAPPRVWERIYSSITTEIRKKPVILRNLIYTGLGLGSEANRYRQKGQTPPAWMRSSLKFFDRAVFSRIRERLGGRLRVAVSGAAPLGKDLAEFYASINLPLIEGYGLTEGGVVALNPFDRPVAGSIGKALPGIQVKISPEGELLIAGETVFRGYYKDPEATAQVLRDGWLHTGDLAEIDADGYLWITGRKKELIVSSNGKKIYPSKIEALFKLEPLVNQVLLIGDKMPYMAALITINPAAAETLKGATGKAPPELARLPETEEEMKRLVKRINRQLAPFEQIRRFRILDRDFTVESGELTPTMKLRRTKVMENYKTLISELYVGRDDI